MNYRMLNVYRSPEGDAGGGGGGGGATVVKPDEARAFLAEFAPDPEVIKTMPDDKLVAYHGKVKSVIDAKITGEVEKVKATSTAEVKANQEKWTKGEIKLELPKDSKLSQADLDEIAADAGRRGLSKEQAEQAVKQRAELRARFENEQVETVKTMRADWAKQVIDHPKLGGANLAATQKTVGRVIDRFMPAADHPLRVQLRQTGLGDHPLFVEFLHEIGSVMKEDDGAGGGGGAGGKKSTEDVLYGATQ